MLKKLTAVTLAIVVMSVGAVSSANDIIKNDLVPNSSTVIKQINEDKIIKLVTPEDGLTTSSKTILLSGRTKENIDTKNLTITVEVYSNRDSAIKYFEDDVYINNGLISEDLYNEMLSAESLEQEFIKFKTKDLKIDLLGLFNEEIKLLSGKNKLSVVAKKKDKVVYKKDIFVTVSDENTALKYLENTSNTNLIKDIKNQIFGNGTK